MPLTQTNAGMSGAGTFVAVGHAYTASGDVVVTGSDPSATLSVVAGDLTFMNATVTITALTAAVASTITIDNSTVNVTAAAGAGALNTYDIGPSGTLSLGSAVTLGIGQTINFADGTGKLDLASASTGASGVITGFQDGSEIVVDNAAYTAANSSYDAATGVLTLAGSGTTPSTSINVRLDPSATLPQYFDLAEVNGNETIVLSTTNTNGIPACFVQGTAIATERGDVAVEALQIGDRVVTLSGGTEAILWIGTRSYSGWLLAGRPELLPVLFKQGSLGAGLPRRDLRVSPKHAMYLDGVLVPAECLLNGSTIVRAPAAAEIRYYHIELDRHDVVLAEGAPSETYMVEGDRQVFHNWMSFAERYPDCELESTQTFAPIVETGAALEAIRARLPRDVASAIKLAA